MTSRLSNFLAARARESYAEPRTAGHDGITAQMAEIVAALLQPGARVLDVGCGQGPALEWFSKAGFDVTGTSVCAEDIRICREKALRVHFCELHSVSEYFRDYPQFDCVWARHVLEHSVAPLYALTEFALALKSGGILYVEVPAPDTSCQHEANPNHYSVMGVKMWASLIERAGFELVEMREIKLTTGAGPDTYFSIIARKL